MEFVLPVIEPREGGTSLLMNPRRQRIFEYVWNHPCSHLRRISRDLNIPPQSLRWHLLRMRDGGLLASRRLKGRTVYYPPWAVREDDVPSFAALANGTRGKIIRFVEQRGRASQTDVFRGLRTYQQAVLPPLEELTKLGILRTWKENGKRFYGLGEAHERLGETYATMAAERLNRLLAVLQRDGVSPKVQSRDPREVHVLVSNGVHRSILRFRLVPVLP